MKTDIPRLKTDIPRLKAKQIIAAPWRNDDTLTYSVIALGEDGFVYRFTANNGWTPIEQRGREYRNKRNNEEDEVI